MSRLKPMSAKRRKEVTTRAKVRVEVLARDPYCMARDKHLVWPSGKVTVCLGRSSQVHELMRGKMRADCYLNPDMCLGLCSECHSFVTLNPNAAHDLGLALWSWETPITFPNGANHE
jgi:hypothetical protein